jgi:hypothetical protein
MSVVSSASSAAHRRQHGGHPARQHGLADARRADHRHVVAAGDGDLHRRARAAPGRCTSAKSTAPLARGRAGALRAPVATAATPSPRSARSPRRRRARRYVSMPAHDRDLGRARPPAPPRRGARAARRQRRRERAAHAPQRAVEPELAEHTSPASRAGSISRRRPARRRRSAGRTRCRALRTSAGARLIVTRLAAAPARSASSAARMRTPPSRTDGAGSPTHVVAGQPARRDRPRRRWGWRRCRRGWRTGWLPACGELLASPGPDTRATKFA